ncbi:MAG: orotidine-5'-phosphate decarboxylase [Actinomycetota bacterium]|nr:orotidine-5'-phosphate decarboxylase [Actinomycetota bacterium]
MVDNTFGSRLHDAMRTRGPLCVGIDPHDSLLSAWGVERGVGGLEKFAMTVVEALADTVSVFKPQSAFFEAYGSAGIAVLERVIAESQAAGALVLLDVKRGDIGSTMAAYAKAYLTEGSSLAVDAITVSPYLGFGSLQPAIDAAAASDRGLFVLCRTSNPESDQVQGAISAGGSTIAKGMVDKVGALNVDATVLGSFGLVIGANLRSLELDLSALNGPILAPGMGAQGGGPQELATLFGAQLPNVLPSSSRQILASGPSVQGLRAAVDRQNDQLRLIGQQSG